MKKLSEKTVQEKALAYLRRRYRPWARWGQVFAKTEVRTRRQFGGKRADGLVAYRSWWGTTRVISLEAKSHKTLRALRLQRENSAWWWRSILVGLAVCLASGAFLFLFKMDDAYLRYAFPLNVLVSASLAYAYFTRYSSRYQRAGVHRQLRQYPANQQWLAFSADSLQHLPPQEQKRLRQVCQRLGFGVLIVHSRGRVQRWLKPTFRRKWFGDFLKYYSKEKEIRQVLA